MGFFGILASLIASLLAAIVVSLFWITLQVKPNPDVFSTLLINWSMAPVGYGAALLVGFSIYPDEIWLMISFASAPVFGAIVGVVYSRRMIQPKDRIANSRNEGAFSLRSMFVIITWLSIAIAISLANGLVFWVLISCIPASLLGWAISVVLARNPEQRLV